MGFRRLDRSMAASGKPELLHRFQIELEHDGVGRADEAHDLAHSRYEALACL